MAVSQEDILKTFTDMSSEDKASLLVSMVGSMDVMATVDAVKKMEEEFGVSAAAAVAVAAGPAAGGDAGAGAAEKTEFNVELTSFGDNKVAVIKAVRGITGLGLKEAKDMVEKAPVNVKEGVAKEEAENILKQLTEAGATGELK